MHSPFTTFPLYRAFHHKHEVQLLSKFAADALILIVYSQGGMQAVRENRYIILSKDFEKAYKKAIKKDDQEHDFYK